MFELPQPTKCIEWSQSGTGTDNHVMYELYRYMYKLRTLPMGAYTVCTACVFALAAFNKLCSNLCGWFLHGDVS